MPEIPTFIYETYTTVLDNGQEVLFQLFRDAETGAFLDAQMSFKVLGGSWGVPYPLEKR
jgi:hypothetical protein